MSDRLTFSNIHRHERGSNLQRHFSVNVWCGIAGDQLIGPYTFPQRLLDEICTEFLQNEMSALSENGLPENTVTEVLPHDGALTHFTRNVVQYPDEQFPDRWIGHGDQQNGPHRSPELSPLDFHVRVYMKNMVYEGRVDTIDI
jgi:hypothetical protein